MRETRTERRFTLLDAALILLALLAVVGVWQRHNLQNLFVTESVLEEYTITFEVKKLRSTTVDHLKQGTALYVQDGDEQILLGTLSQNVAASAATEELYDKNGNRVQAVYPQDEYEYLLDVTGVLSCRGLVRDGSFLLGGRMYLANNKTVSVRTETADIEITIKGIEKVK